MSKAARAIELEQAQTTEQALTHPILVLKRMDRFSNMALTMRWRKNGRRPSSNPSQPSTLQVYITIKPTHSKITPCLTCKRNASHKNRRLQLLIAQITDTNSFSSVKSTLGRLSSSTPLAQTKTALSNSMTCRKTVANMHLTRATQGQQRTWKGSAAEKQISLEQAVTRALVEMLQITI